MLVDVPGGIFGGILVLDHQPFVAFFALFQFHQNKAAPQFFPVQAELDFSLFQLLQRAEVALQVKSPTVPYHHCSRAIIAFRNFPFEIAVVQRMILGHDRQPLVRVALRRSLGHGPRLQRPIDGQPEIVVQPRGPVLLNHKRVAVLGPGTDFQLWQFRLRQACTLARRGRFWGRRSLLWDLAGGRFGRARRLRRPVKAPFSPVFFKLGHESILSQTIPRARDLPAAAS